MLNEQPFTPEEVAEVSARTLEQWQHNGFGPWEVAGLTRIMSATMAANTASRRVMDKCGLRPDCDSPGGAPAQPP